MTNPPEPTPASEDGSQVRNEFVVLVGMLAILGPLSMALGFLFQLAVVFVLAGVFLCWRGRQALAAALWGNRWPLLCLLAPAVWLQVHLPGDWQDWAGETPHAAAALRAHLDREASVPVAGIFALPEGPLLLGETGPSGLFSSLVGLFHDLTGERPANARILNGVLGYALLATVWFSFRRLGGWGISLSVLGFLLLTPLVSMAARGGGDQLLFAVAAVAWALGAGWRFQNESRQFFRLWLAAGFGLATASLLYPMFTAAGRPWSEAFETALFRLFAPESQEPGSPLLMVAGVGAGLILLMAVFSRRKAGEAASPARFLPGLAVAVLAGAVVAVGHEALAATPWSAPQTLLLHVLSAWTLVWALARREQVRPLPWRWLGPVLGISAMLWGMPRITEPVSALVLRLDGRRVLRDFAREQPSHYFCFYALDRPEGLIAEGFSSGPAGLLSGSTGLPPLLSSRLFARFYVLTTSTLNPREGTWETDVWQRLPEGLVTRVVRERWISLDRKAFVHEVVGVRQKDGSVLAPPAPESGPKMSADALTEAILRGGGVGR